MTTVEAPLLVPVEIRTCRRCGFDFPRVPGRPGRPRIYCADCRQTTPNPDRPRPPRADPAVLAQRRRKTGLLPRMDPTFPGYQLAASVTEYRLAIELATSALKLGRPAEALEALLRVEAPARSLT